MSVRATAAMVLAVLAAGCVRPPLPLQGEFPPTTVGDVQADPRTGDRVRWGGVVVESRSGADETCLEIVSRPLGRDARPGARSDRTYGRFLACTRRFLDPAVYAAEREVTVVGTVTSVDPGRVGERHYRFPRVAIEAIYLWPVREPEPRVIYYTPWVGVWGYYGYPVYPYYRWHHHGHRHRHW